MAGQKRATKLEYLKILEKYDDNDILLIDTRKDPWIKKVGSITPLEEMSQFTEIEKEAINFAFRKAKYEGRKFLALTSERDIVHMFIGSNLNTILCKANSIQEVNKKLINLYNKYKSIYDTSSN